MKLLSETSELTDAVEPASPARPRRTWRRKFHDALRGLKCGIRGQSSFFVHFFFTALVITAAIVLRCNYLEWCLLLGCIGLVLVAELINCAVETLFQGLPETGRERAWRALDIAAGAVLLASVIAAAIGLIVFLNRLFELFGLNS